jgi:hypothetical protein
MTIALPEARCRLEGSRFRTAGSFASVGVESTGPVSTNNRPKKDRRIFKSKAHSIKGGKWKGSRQNAAFYEQTLLYVDGLGWAFEQ